jgi:hypothetical protein
MCTINLKSNLLAVLSRTMLGASTLPTLGLLLMQLYDSVLYLPSQHEHGLCDPAVGIHCKHIVTQLWMSHYCVTKVESNLSCKPSYFQGLLLGNSLCKWVIIISRQGVQVVTNIFVGR